MLIEVRDLLTGGWRHSPGKLTIKATSHPDSPEAHSQQRELALNLLSSSFRTCGVVMVLLIRTLVTDP